MAVDGSMQALASPVAVLYTGCQVYAIDVVRSPAVLMQQYATSLCVQALIGGIGMVSI